MTALTQSSKTDYFGLRPMDPMTDLRGVADLIEEAFANDLDSSGQSALQELRWLSYFKPLLWWMVLVNLDRTDFLSGFVWEENGRIVGNITVNQMGGLQSKRWLISNLAVADDYRRRGIANSLMYAGEELVREYNGSHILLQVRADNHSARQLYKAHKFDEITGTTRLSIPQTIAVATTNLPPTIILRERQADWQDTQAIYHLARETIPSRAQYLWPVRHQQFRISNTEQFKNIFRALINYRFAYWIAETNHRVVAMVNIKPGLINTQHTIELIVHPDWRGRLERPLISRALNYLHRCGNGSISIKQPVDHVEAIAIFKELGFQEEQTLLWMKYTC